MVGKSDGEKREQKKTGRKKDCETEGTLNREKVRKMTVIVGGKKKK